MKSKLGHLVVLRLAIEPHRDNDQAHETRDRVVHKAAGLYDHGEKGETYVLSATARSSFC